MVKKKEHTLLITSSNQISNEGLNNYLKDFYSSLAFPCPIQVDPDSSILKSCCKNCKSNPNCLNSLGFSNWYKQESVKAYMHNQGLEEDIPYEKETRNVGDAAGLRNLGATCYLNALLQTWFSLYSFVDGVYAYERGSVSSDNVIQYLASTFASLQLTVTRVHDPSPFIHSLNLQPGIQQDPHEFSKLLLQMIERGCVNQSNRTVKHLIQNHFQGKYSYITQCLTCCNESISSCLFLELEASVTDGIALEEALQKLISKEFLQDSNQYHCRVCESKQDAVRYIRLDALPPILNIQLMRFVFDLQTLNKKKLKTSNVFPSVLDMRPYMSTTDNSRYMDPEDYIYELRNAILHKGTNADSGHYTCRIYNQETNKWIDFDDEMITVLDNVGFDFTDSLLTNGSTSTIDLSGDGHTPTRTTTKGKGKNKRKRLQEGMYESQSTYMLMYVRQSSLKSIYSSPPQVPSYLKDILQSRNQVLESEFKGLQCQLERIQEEFIKRRIDLHSMLNTSLLADPMNESCFYLDSQELKSALQFSISSSSSSCSNESSKESSKESSILISNNKLTCSHGKLNFIHLANTKRFSIQGYKNLKSLGFKVDLDLQEICMECFLDFAQEKYILYTHEIQVKEYSQLPLKSTLKSNETFLLSKSWLQEWKKKIPNFLNTKTGLVPYPNQDPTEYTCPHGLIQDLDSIVLISKERCEYLQSVFPGFSCPSQLEIQHCSTCEEDVQDLACAKSIGKSLKNKFKSLWKPINNSVMYFQEFRYYLVSREFIDAWTEYIGGRRKELVGISNASLMCCHDLLLYDLNDKWDRDGAAFRLLIDSEWTQLVELFGDASPTLYATVMTESIINGDVVFKTNVQVCTDCRRVRLLDYVSTFVLVKVVQPLALNDTNEDITKDSKEEEYKEICKTPTHSSNDLWTPKRSSSRQNKNKVNSNRIELDKFMTIREFKTQLSTQFSVPILCQRLLLRNQELNQDELTIESLQVLPYEEFTLEILKQDESLLLEDACVRNMGPEVGFSGTELMSFPFVKESSSSSSYWTCQFCTFMNDLKLLYCEMCNNVKGSS